jgi:nucleoside-diphosphate-sugar epimerase
MIDAARKAGVRRFIHISSLSAREPSLSDYGWSKARSERLVAASGLDWTAIRPPAIYGPGDRETFDLFRMARRGLVPLPPRGRLSVIHVDDLCRLILDLIAADDSWGEIYEPDDGTQDGWDHREFARALGQAFGKRAVPLSMPRFALRAASRADRLFRRGNAKLTRDRVSYFCHPDWVAAPDRRPPPRLWQPQVPTAQGLTETADWYRAQGWIS